MMIVSIVMPETGLRAVVAMALAATDVKKNEKTSVRPRPDQRRRRTSRRGCRGRSRRRRAETTTPIRIFMIAMSRSVRSGRAASPCRKAFAAIEKEPTTILQRLDDAEDAGRRDRADADEPDVAAEDLAGGHLRDRHRRPDRRRRPGTAGR